MNDGVACVKLASSTCGGDASNMMGELTNAVLKVPREMTSCCKYSGHILIAINRGLSPSYLYIVIQNKRITHQNKTFNK